MLGWLLNIAKFSDLFPGVVMRFNVALCFALFSGALLITQFLAKGCRSPAFFLLVSLGTLIGLLTIAQEIFNINTGIDQLFVTDPTPVSSRFPHPGRMAFNASLNLCLLGIGLVFFCVKSRFLHIVSQYLFHAVTLISVIALIGFFYNISLYNSLFYITSMAYSTAILFLALSLAAALIKPRIGLAAIFTGERVGNQVARRLVNLILLMILVFGS
jgi:two-component system, sporulation sensor kinase E